MGLKTKRLRKRTCPVCDRRFQPINPRQLYDSHVCGQKIYRYRVAQKLERLHQLEQQTREALKESAA